MVLEIDTGDFHVDTFEDMQEGLANYLNQSSNNEGIWTVAEKKRHLNLGCINVVAAVMSPKTFIEKELSGTSDDPLNTFTAPNNMLKPYRMWLNGLAYQEVSDETWFSGLSSLVQQGSAIGKRIFWWDDDQKVIFFSTAITDTQKLTFRYVRMPRLLTDPSDIPDLHPLLWHVPPMWAAWRMLYRDEEHGDRGRSARADYRDAISVYNNFKFKEIGNKQTNINLDPLVFLKKRSEFGAVDLGDNFDIFD